MTENISDNAVGHDLRNKTAMDKTFPSYPKVIWNSTSGFTFKNIINDIISLGILPE